MNPTKTLPVHWDRPSFWTIVACVLLGMLSGIALTVATFVSKLSTN